MPIEIRELIIKATIDNEGANNQTSQHSADGGNEASLNEIAERVFAIIKEKSER